MMMMMRQLERGRRWQKTQTAAGRRGRIFNRQLGRCCVIVLWLRLVVQHPGQAVLQTRIELTRVAVDQAVLAGVFSILQAVAVIVVVVPSLVVGVVNVSANGVVV